jgi:UDP-glucose 4-epimerase
VRCLVTGGAGYIGAHVVALLIERGDEVLVLDDLSTGVAERVGSARLVVGDVTDRDLTRATLMEFRPDVVVHFAAKKHVGDSMAQPSLYYRDNVGGLLSLLDAMRASGCDRIVFSSSCSVYGINDDSQVNEATPTGPISPYGESKLIGEWILADYARAHGIRYVALRYFNAAGADEARKLGDPIARNIVPIVLQAHRDERSVPVFGCDYETPDGSCVRDYIHVMDLADAHLVAAEKIDGLAQNKIYNLSSGRGYSVLEVIKMAEKVVGASIPWHDLGRREGDPPAMVAVPTRANEELGWSAKHSSLEEIVGSAWRGHLA